MKITRTCHEKYGPRNFTKFSALYEKLPEVPFLGKDCVGFWGLTYKYASTLLCALKEMGWVERTSLLWKKCRK